MVSLGDRVTRQSKRSPTFAIGQNLLSVVVSAVHARNDRETQTSKAIVYTNAGICQPGTGIIE